MWRSMPRLQKDMTVHGVQMLPTGLPQQLRLVRHVSLIRVYQQCDVPPSLTSSLHAGKCSIGLKRKRKQNNDNGSGAGCERPALTRGAAASHRQEPLAPIHLFHPPSPASVSFCVPAPIDPVSQLPNYMSTQPRLQPWTGRKHRGEECILETVCQCANHVSTLGAAVFHWNALLLLLLLQQAGPGKSTTWWYSVTLR